MSFKIKCANFVTQDCLQAQTAGVIQQINAQGCDFVVSPTGPYTDLLSAVADATAYANANGGATIVLCNGTYTDSFSLQDRIDLEGQGRNVNISGTITLLGNSKISNVGITEVVGSVSGASAVLEDVGFSALAGISPISLTNGHRLVAYNLTGRAGVMGGPPAINLGQGDHLIINSDLQSFDDAATASLINMAEPPTFSTSLTLKYCETRGPITGVNAAIVYTFIGSQLRIAPDHARGVLLDIGGLYFGNVLTSHFGNNPPGIGAGVALVSVATAGPGQFIYGSSGVTGDSPPGGGSPPQFAPDNSVFWAPTAFP